MKKILVSFATLAVISSSIMTTTAWVKNNQHIQIKDPDHELGRDTSYSDLDFGNFQSAMHPFDFQSLDPTIADVNVNINDPVSVYNYISSQLDQRLANYYLQFGISSTTLAYNIYYDSLGTNFNIIDQSTEKQWVPPTLQYGQYKCYNLQLINLLSHTSFTFSLNYCNFDLDTTIDPIGDNLPNCSNQVHEIDGAGGHIWPPNDLSPSTIDLNSYLQNMNDSGIKWKDVQGSKWKDYLLRNDNFFMNPITWNWNSWVNEDDDKGGAHAALNESSESAGYNSQIGYANVQSHNGIYYDCLYDSPPEPNLFNANTFSNASTFGWGSLTEYGQAGYPNYSQMNNVWDTDSTQYDRGGWTANETTLLYIAQGYMGGNTFKFQPAEGGWSNVEDFPTGDGPWNITWTFNTTELDTSYKDIFSQASAYSVTGLEDYSTFMTYKDPNKILKNYSIPLDSSNGINEVYDLYNSAQTVIFNSNYVASASVDYQSVALDKSYTINQGSHVIDVRFNDPQIAKEYEGNYNEGALEFHMDIQNNYDFSQGVNAATWDPSTRMLEIYFSQQYANFLESFWADEHGPGKTAYLLDWIRDYKVGEKIWSNFLNPNPNIQLDEIVNQFIPRPSEKEKQTFDLIDRQTCVPPTGAHLDDYAWGLQNKINKIKPNKGLVLKLKIDDFKRDIKQANNPSLGEVPLTPITSGSTKHFQTNYWDQVLFNQN